ncbi:hypothetical protein GOODEAATRI_016273, partial [Goodea atripinnis]
LELVSSRNVPSLPERGPEGLEMSLWLLKWAVCLLGLLARSASSSDEDFGGESGSGMLLAGPCTIIINPVKHAMGP